MFQIKKIKEGKKKLFLFVFYIVSLFNLYSQEYSRLPFKAAFKWAPFGVFDFFSGPNMKLGIDYAYSGKVYGGFDGGMIFLPYPPSLKNNIGFFARKEIKFFQVDQSSYLNKTFYYWGFELMYKYQEFGRGDTIALPGKDHYFRDYYVYKNTMALHVKAGGILYFGPENKKIPTEGSLPKFFMEFFAGAGIRQTTVYCAGLTPKEAESREIGPTLDVMFNTQNGFHVWPSFELGIKFGWKMW